MRLLQDFRYSVRLLRRTPVTTLVAVLSLALGIGANAAIFSLINGLLLRPLPVSEPNRLVSIQTASSGLSAVMFQEFVQSQKVFSSMFLWFGGGMDNLDVDGATYASSVETVSGDYFSTLGVKPLLGRLIDARDVSLVGESAKVAVLGFGCWKNRYHGAADVLGKTIRVNGTPLTIIGVTPESFHGLQIDIAEEAVVPMGYSGLATHRNPETTWFQVFGRLKPGVSLEQARAQMEAVWPRVRLASLPSSFKDAQREEFLARRIAVEPAATGNSFLRQRMTRPLQVLMCLAALVLSIACVNLANLMLARAVTRLPEISVRAALGSGMWRIMRQLLIEAVLLSATGALFGLVLAVWASRALAAAVWSGFVPLAMNVGPDWRVMAFTASISLATGLAFGLTPLWILRRPEIASILGQNNRNVRGGRGWVGQALVSSQITLSLVLLVGATLFAESLANLYHQNPGFRRDGILLMQLFPKPGVRALTNRTSYFYQLADGLKQIPGVQSVSYSHMGPVTVYEFKNSVGPLHGSTSAQAIFELVGPDFFNVLGMKVLAGRQFSWQDDDKRRRIVMVSETLARQLFQDRNAVGQHIKTGNDPKLQDLEIIGVVNSASLWRAQSHQPAAYFLPLLQQDGYDEETVTLRVDGDSSMAAAEARKVVSSLGQQYALSVETLNHRIDRILVSERMIATLSGFFAGLSILLAAIGLYGVMSFVVTSRTSEIGVRIALGAQRSDVMAMVLKQVLVTTALGVTVGIPLTVGGAKFIQGMIFGLPARDTGTVLVAVLILVSAALLAGYWPARHAAAIDPVEALRSN